MARVGIIGTGWGARVQAPAFREAGLEVVAIAGSQPERTRRVAGQLGIEPVDRWPELIARGDVDLVTIVTPPSEHVVMAVAALDAGKHVVCEKPTALNAGEAEQLLEAGERNPGRVAIIDHELRFAPSFRAAHQRIAEIGNVRYAEVRYASPSRGDRSREWNWWSDAGRGGGVWGAVGSHYVDALRYLGMEIEAAQASLQTVIRERPFGDAMKKVTADDLAEVNLRLRGGAVAMMTFSAVAAGPDELTALTLHGENGAMRLVGGQLLISLQGEPFSVAVESREDHRGNSPGGAFGTGTFHLARALRAALDEGDRSALAPAATLEDGLAQQRVLDAARRSSANGGAWEPI